MPLQHPLQRTVPPVLPPAGRAQPPSLSASPQHPHGTSPPAGRCWCPAWHANSTHSTRRQQGAHSAFCTTRVQPRGVKGLCRQGSSCRHAGRSNRSRIKAARWYNCPRPRSGRSRRAGRTRKGKQPAAGMQACAAKHTAHAAPASNLRLHVVTVDDIVAQRTQQAHMELWRHRPHHLQRHGNQQRQHAVGNTATSLLQMELLSGALLLATRPSAPGPTKPDCTVTRPNRLPSRCPAVVQAAHGTCVQVIEVSRIAI